MKDLLIKSLAHLLGCGICSFSFYFVPFYLSGRQINICLALVFGVSYHLFIINVLNHKNEK